MQDTGPRSLEQSLEDSLEGLKKGEWIRKVATIADAHGHFQSCGHRHFGAFVERGDTLLVTFESMGGAQVNPDGGRPIGWDFVLDQGWSTLGLFADGDTWFRDRHVYGYFDRLIDDGFFEDFEKVIFYGAGPAGYAAAAFSVAAPGARVVVLQPQATLDPRVTEWDDRFTEMRRTSFTDRYGYAPDMLDAAQAAYVLYDPSEELDAMHAALFTRPNVTKFRMRFFGSALQGDLQKMQILAPLLEQAADDRLTTRSFAQLHRARRDYGGFLRNMLGTLDTSDRPYLAAMLCRNVTSRMNVPRFRRRLDALEKAEAEGKVTLPPRPEDSDG
ncbi:phosphoadenosine phosphosulfate reductase [Lutimaribacter sp. EGI FJ00015]|uniref:Phosphoadenosine phosphosulfate reductase n=1 Tax=Lutimaribacter degradans TaxID=2945989 RepID=A0ACC5ZRL0_9RHOB|nr:phosphoadenosine phosphosulfate reductase [Lutimaribacter sp. EGI FJ00013]MCM2560959.1 phosphoadenosine phosphosulfate reductase [Lutimaribacter sp. EGI FJ00013]MCO0612095.1 phosphoadenosine phosphosulfate reductase [Lutimaribacter sp. EGI FJ00015]MCO0634785.1 phosphoadenosine phosphosulfate reductase [Lutimaribacter sp. EGI FJ00014]